MSTQNITVQQVGTYQKIACLMSDAPLTARRRIIFEGRDLHAYRPGLELTSAVSEYQRIEKTVFIKAPRWISYDGIADLIRVIKAASADGIGLVVDRLPPNQRLSRRGLSLLHRSRPVYCLIDRWVAFIDHM